MYLCGRSSVLEVVISEICNMYQMTLNRTQTIWHEKYTESQLFIVSLYDYLFANILDLGVSINSHVTIYWHSYTFNKIEKTKPQDF